MANKKRLARAAFETACLTVGFSVAKQVDRASVKDLIARLYPFATEHPLIRLGSNGDGGYLVPDDLEGIAACFSPGVARQADFEKSLIELGIPCFMADASVEIAPIDGPLTNFIKKFVGVVDGPETITLDDWIDAYQPGGDDLLLQMDIDGGEWPVFLNVSGRNLRRFRIIVVELHDLQRLMDEHAFPIIKATFDRLLESFHVVHNHPNNCDASVRCGSIVIPRVLEMTFIRKDRVELLEFAQIFPHPLDVRNDITRPDLRLPFNWFHHNA